MLIIYIIERIKFQSCRGLIGPIGLKVSFDLYRCIYSILLSQGAKGEIGPRGPQGNK